MSVFLSISIRIKIEAQVEIMLHGSLEIANNKQTRSLKHMYHTGTQLWSTNCGLHSLFFLSTAVGVWGIKIEAEVKNMLQGSLKIANRQMRG